MHFRTLDNQEGRLERPNLETISWEWDAQLAALQDLRRSLARGEGAGSVLAFRAVTFRLPETNAA